MWSRIWSQEAILIIGPFGWLVGVMACWLEWWVLVLQLIGRSNNVRPVLHRIAFHWWGWRPAASYSRPAMCKEDAFYWIWATISSRFLKFFYDCSVREGENDVRICHWGICLFAAQKRRILVKHSNLTHLTQSEIMNLFGKFQNQSKCRRSECLHWWCQVNAWCTCVTTWSSSNSQWRPFGWKHCGYSQPPLPMTGFCLPLFFLCVPCQPCLYWCLYMAFCGCLGVDGSLGGPFVRRWSDSTALGTGRALSLDNVPVNQCACPLQVAKWKDIDMFTIS